MTEFTLTQSLFGGALIGVAAVLLMMLYGRVAGVTGILSGLMPPMVTPDWAWRAAFLLGMLASPWLFRLLTGSEPAIEIAADSTLLLISGVIVGIGVTFGSGCTSGHGVCGLARLSPRSLAATLTFMASTAVTVFVVRHVIGG